MHFLQSRSQNSLLLEHKLKLSPLLIRFSFLNFVNFYAYCNMLVFDQKNKIYSLRIWLKYNFSAPRDDCETVYSVEYNQSCLFFHWRAVTNETTMMSWLFMVQKNTALFMDDINHPLPVFFTLLQVQTWIMPSFLQVPNVPSRLFLPNQSMQSHYFKTSTQQINNT